MFTKGYWTIGRVRGVPIRLHWSIPIGAVAFARGVPSLGGVVGYLVVVILHELGHAALVRRMGHRPLAIRVHALGGDCSYAGDPTRGDVAVIAWGGVLAQALLWIAAQLVLVLAGPPGSSFGLGLAAALTSTNAWLMMINLMPVPPLDGYWAWQLFGIWWQGRRELREYHAQRRARARAIDRERAAATARRKPTPPRSVAQDDDVDDIADDDPRPMPDEVRAVLDRVAREAHAAQRAKRAWDPGRLARPESQTSKKPSRKPD